MTKNPMDEFYPEVDWDDCYVIASDCCCVYFDVFKDKDGKWYMFADIDTEQWSDVLCNGDGPYDTEKSAIAGGVSCAVDWFVNNGIGDFEYGNNIPKEFTT